MKSKRLLVAFLVTAFTMAAQSRSEDMAAILERPLQTPEVVAFQIRQYLFQRISPLPAPQNAVQWSAESN